MFGAILSKVDVRDYRGICCTSAQLPEEFEIKMRDIKNQGFVNSCVAHALASVVEYYNYKQLNQDVPMSTGYIYGNRKTSFHKGQGMIVRDAISAVCKYGDVPHTVFPYNIEVPEAIQKFEESYSTLHTSGLSNRFTEYYSLKKEKDIKAALLNNQPVVMAMHWYEDIKIVNGVMETQCGKYDGSHCMVIYGWNKDGWKVQNSWGESWGNNGRFILPYYVSVQEAWGIIDTYYDSLDGLDIKKPFNTQLGKIIAKIINIFANFIKKL